MTTQEFSSEFDILYNNITSNEAVDLNEYEKSVFLTKAQEEILKAYITGKGNKFGEGIDNSSKRQIDFSNLIEDAEFGKYSIDGNHVILNSIRFGFPKDALQILNEEVKVSYEDSITKHLAVVPINHLDYTRRLSKPFKYPLKGQAWRIMMTDKQNNTPYVEILIGPSSHNIMSNTVKYIVRYVRTPKPIILDNLEDVSICGLSHITECELPKELHSEILQRAVELAKVSFMGDLGTQVNIGLNSATNLGIIPQSK